MASLSGHTLASYLEHLERRAHAEDGVPAALASHARDVTLRNLAYQGSGELDAATCRQIRAYFRAVIRRSAARSRVPGAREYRVRAMRASIAADLRASGADDGRVHQEVAAWQASFEGAA